MAGEGRYRDPIESGARVRSGARVWSGWRGDRGLRWRTIPVAVGTVAVVGSLSSCSKPSVERGGRPAPASSTVTVELGLRRDDRGLADAVRKSSDPASPRYRRFLTATQIADRYGASERDRRHVLRVLHAAGIENAVVSADGGTVTAVLHPDEVEQVFGARVEVQRASDRSTVADVTRPLDVPASLRGPVTEVAGGRSTIRAVPATDVSGGPVTPSCGDGSTLGVGAPSPLGSWYGFDDDLYRDGRRGRGQRLAVLAVGGWEPASLAAFADCYGTSSASVTRHRAPGTVQGPARPETTLDVIVASSFAPEAEIDVLQYDRQGTIATGLVAAVDRSAPRPYAALSTSIGYCERELGRDEVAIAERALLALAAMGTTVVASSGDTGSAACSPDAVAAVQYPASSPWATGVGGTSPRTGATDAIVSEVVWRTDVDGTVAASGGGSSDRFTRPWFQEGLHPAGSRRDQRLVPDVAFAVDPTLVPPIPLCTEEDACTWHRLAGTSAPAPALAAAIAGTSTRLGLLAPLVRRLAATSRGVHDVTEGSNRVLGLTCCDAAPGFDLASGWGSFRLPDLVALATRPRH